MRLSYKLTTLRTKQAKFENELIIIKKGIFNAKNFKLNALKYPFKFCQEAIEAVSHNKHRQQKKQLREADNKNYKK